MSAALKSARGNPLPLGDSDNNPVLANQVVSKPSELHKIVAALAIIPAHDRSAYNKFFPAWKYKMRPSPAGPQAALVSV